MRFSHRGIRTTLLMKLAEALALRADVQKHIRQMQSRLNQSALVQEGEQPPEDPQALLAELADGVSLIAVLASKLR